LDTKLEDKRKVLDDATVRLADVRYHQAEKLKARSAEIREIRQNADGIREETARQNEDQERVENGFPYAVKFNFRGMFAK